MPDMTTPISVIADDSAYAQAVEDAVKAASAYYAGGTSPLDDNAYDRLVRGIAAWESEHPDQVLPESPLVVAGEGAGSKRAKAEDLGIRLATPDEFAILVADYLSGPQPAADPV